MFLCDTELSSGPAILSYLALSYETLLEQNLRRIIAPYSAMEIECVVQQEGLGRQAIEAKYVYAPSSHSMAADQIYFMGC